MVMIFYYTIIKGKKINNEKIRGVVGTIMTNYALEKYLKKKIYLLLELMLEINLFSKKCDDNDYDLGRNIWPYFDARTH